MAMVVMGVVMMVPVEKKFMMKMVFVVVVIVI